MANVSQTEWRVISLSTTDLESDRKFYGFLLRSLTLGIGFPINKLETMPPILWAMASTADNTGCEVHSMWPPQSGRHVLYGYVFLKSGLISVKHRNV